MTLKDKKIDVPTLNEEHKYFYPEENVKHSIDKILKWLELHKTTLITGGCVQEVIKEEIGDLE